MKYTLLNEVTNQAASSAEIAFTRDDFEMLSQDTLIESMRKAVADKHGTTPEMVRISGMHFEGDAYMLDCIVGCHVCGKVLTGVVCPCVEGAIKPKVNVERWRGFEVHSTERREGGNIYLDEVLYEAKQS